MRCIKSRLSKNIREVPEKILSVLSRHGKRKFIQMIRVLVEVVRSLKIAVVRNKCNIYYNNKDWEFHHVIVKQDALLLQDHRISTTSNSPEK